MRLRTALHVSLIGLGAVSLIVGLMATAPHADGQDADAGCARPDPTRGCPRTAPYTAREVRVLIRFSATHIRACAWEFLESHAPSSLTVTVPRDYVPGAEIDIEPSTFGGTEEQERVFLECVRSYVTPPLPYVGRAIQMRIDVGIPRPTPSLEPAVRASMRARADAFAGCFPQTQPTMLWIRVHPSGVLSLLGFRTLGARVDSIHHDEFGCVGRQLVRVPIRAPHREGSVELAWPL